MKLIIDIPEEQYNDIVKHLTDNDGNYAYSDFNLREIIRNGTPYNPTGDLISREALKKAFEKVYPLATNEMGGVANKRIYEIIDNAPTVEAPKNAVNCVLTMFGKCSYNETGCSDCEIKFKIRKALEERLQE